MRPAALAKPTAPAAPAKPPGTAAPAGPAAPAQGTSGLSIAQMLRVMRVEFQRARTTRQPLCCLMVAVDGLPELQKRGGFSLKQAAMRAAYEHLKTVARERQCFGMSLLSGDRIMAIFPGTPPSVLAEFGNALCAHARTHPIAYTGLYRDEPPAKPAVAKPTSTDPAVSETPAKPSANVSEHGDDAHEITFEDHPDDRLKSRDSLVEPGTDAEPKAPLPAAEAAPTAAPAPKRKPGEPVLVEVRLSLGASHNLLAETSSSFEGLVEKAGRALQTAREANGDRYVMWREAEAEIAGLRDDIAAQRASFRQEEALLAEEASEVGGLQQAALVDRIQAIFSRVPRTPEIEAVEKEIIALAVAELYEGRQKAVEAQMAEHARLVDQLERRIAKLTSLLGVTEEELQRVLSMKSIDEGVASIYRTVQGLGAEAAQAEQKKAMMAVIFNENMAFQKRSDAQNAEPAKAA
jgi:GGDEF domain-containing protein